jgi:hypothetical protein
MTQKPSRLAEPSVERMLPVKAHREARESSGSPPPGSLGAPPLLGSRLAEGTLEPKTVAGSRLAAARGLLPREHRFVDCSRGSLIPEHCFGSLGVAPASSRDPSDRFEWFPAVRSMKGRRGVSRGPQVGVNPARHRRWSGVPCESSGPELSNLAGESIRTL